MKQINETNAQQTNAQQTNAQQTNAQQTNAQQTNTHTHIPTHTYIVLCLTHRSGRRQFVLRYWPLPENQFRLPSPFELS